MGATVLVIGSGGREHALVWKLSTSAKVLRVIAAPGNDGFSDGLAKEFAQKIERWPAKLGLQGPELQAEFKRLGAQALEAKVDLVVVGPDNPLADGIVDVFSEMGLLSFGPTQAAAQLEASKAFAKDVMKAAGVPTAKYFTAKENSEAQKILKSVPWPQTKETGSKSASKTEPDPGWVIKADGLALGKGVRVCSSYEEASAAAAELIGISGSLVIEERLRGEEISWLAFCDGERCALFEPARDYKRLSDGGIGPNTGGMGAFSPVPEVPSSWKERVRKEVFLPVLGEMKKRGMPFRGILYAGLMCDFAADRYSVLEFNARFGDPETQVLLPRMADDLYAWCEASAKGDLRQATGREDVQFLPEVAVGVVGAARGYPEKPEKGHAIEVMLNNGTTSNSGSDSDQSCKKAPDYFYAGVTRDGGVLKTSGGRVFLSLGLGKSFEQARAQAYEHIRRVKFEGIQYRKDIAKDVVEKVVKDVAKNTNGGLA